MAIAAGIAAATVIVGCRGGSPELPPSASGASALRALTTNSKIHHIVIIFQENRSFDDLFNGFPGANTVRFGYNSENQKVPLRPIALTAGWDLDHTHYAFVKDYDGGKMNGFDKDPGHCFGLNRCPAAGLRAYGFVPHSESAPYFTMAKRFTLADDMFQTNEGPSFPAHQYIVSGTSTITDGSPLRAADNPINPSNFSNGGCDSPQNALVPLIDAAGNENLYAYPCFKRISLMQELDEKSLSWRYYQSVAGANIWNAPDALLSIRKSKEYDNVVIPSQRIFKDIAAGQLADVTWVMPDTLWSDHARANNGSGPSWVADVVNAIGKSAFWNDTAIFVTWDDWGGWYDHVSPPQYNSYELGFRVPLIVISPYAKTHYISTAQHEFGSILKFSEEVFDLPSMHTTDERADDLADCFDFSQAPTKFKPIAAPLGPSYFIKHPYDGIDPDDDASDYAVLYSFGESGKQNDGRAPAAKVIAHDGSTYGTTEYGGTTNANCPGGCGTVYALNASGGESIVYRFAGGNDGAAPQSGLLDERTSLYGTTSAGGAGSCTGGCGTVFRIDAATGSETVVYRFSGGSDAATPLDGLTPVGKLLYGTTEFGGHHSALCGQGCGTIFSVDPATGAEKIVHAFAGGADGAFPVAGLIAVKGTLYGTTEYGGTNTPFCETGCGTVFSITVKSGAKHSLYHFRYGPNNNDGANPNAHLVEQNGTLYGTTYAGGSASRGTIFSVSSGGGEHVMHSFQCCSTTDGTRPEAGLIAYNGGFYGTTSQGGPGKNGTVFSITTSGSESVVYGFTGTPDGSAPQAPLTEIGGMLFGTTSTGGDQSEGTVFKVAP